MPTKTWFRDWPGRSNVRLEYYGNTWVNNKVNGKVVLKESAHEFNHEVVTAHGGTDSQSNCSGAGAGLVYSPTSDVINTVKARLNGKLHRGDASMGMTLATCGQSAAMLLGRFNQINDLMGITKRRRARRAIRSRPNAHSLANDVLEVEFGWRPFISDIGNCLATLSSPSMPPVHFRAAARPNVNINQKTVGQPTWTTTINGRARVTATGSYSVSNPNVWLLNQLGLLNPFQVAWDRVPWSWVVNMFVNANQLIGSFSDTFGLNVYGGSLTISSALFREQTEVWNPGSPKFGARYYANTNSRYRHRESLSNLTPSLQFRMPNLNWELAIIASALAVQRSSSL